MSKRIGLQLEHVAAQSRAELHTVKMEVGSIQSRATVLERDQAIMRSQIDAMQKFIAGNSAPRPPSPVRLAAEFADNREVDPTIVKVNLSQPAPYAALSALTDWIDDLLPKTDENDTYEISFKEGSHKD